MFRATFGFVLFTLSASFAHAQGEAPFAPSEPAVEEAAGTPADAPAASPPPAAATPAAPAADAEPEASATPTEAPPVAAPSGAATETSDTSGTSEKPLLDRALIRGAHAGVAGVASAGTIVGALGATYVFYQLAISDPTLIGEVSVYDDILFGVLAVGTWFLAPLVAVVVAATSVGFLGGATPAWRTLLDGLIGAGAGGAITGVPGALLGGAAGVLLAFGVASFTGSTPDAGLVLTALAEGALVGFLVLAPVGAAAGAIGGSTLGGFLGADPDTFEWE